MLRARILQQLDLNSVLVLFVPAGVILVLVVIVSIIIIIIVVAIVGAENLVDLSVGQGYHVEIPVRTGLNIGSDAETGAEEE